MQSSRAFAQLNAIFMSQVYLWMAIGLTISGLVSFSIFQCTILMNYAINHTLVWSIFIIVTIIIQFATVIFLSHEVEKKNIAVLRLTYLGYAILIGITFSTIYLAFSTQDISEAFFITAFAFGCLSAFAYFTNYDLKPLSSFLFMGLFGFIGLSIMLIIFPSILRHMLSMSVNTVGILVFAGLSAFETQRIKHFSDMDSEEEAKKASITGALILYLDFLGLFLNILRFFGGHKHS